MITILLLLLLSINELNAEQTSLIQAPKPRLKRSRDMPTSLDKPKAAHTESTTRPHQDEGKQSTTFALQKSSINDHAFLSLAINNTDNIEDVIIQECHHITDVSISRISKFPHLKSLTINACNNISDRVMGDIIQIKELEKLSLINCRCIGNFGLWCLSYCHTLRSLTIIGCSTTPKALEDISKIQTLTLLTIDPHEFNDTISLNRFREVSPHVTINFQHGYQY